MIDETKKDVLEPRVKETIQIITRLLTFPKNLTEEGTKRKEELEKILKKHLSLLTSEELTFISNQFSDHNDDLPAYKREGDFEINMDNISAMIDAEKTLRLSLQNAEKIV